MSSLQRPARYETDDYTTNRSASKISTHILTPEKRLMHFLHHPRFPRRRRTHFPLELLEEGKDLAIRTDLESCGVEICNMEVRLSASMQKSGKNLTSIFTRSPLCLWRISITRT